MTGRSSRRLIEMRVRRKLIHGATESGIPKYERLLCKKCNQEKWNVERHWGEPAGQAARYQGNRAEGLARPETPLSHIIPPEEILGTGGGTSRLALVQKIMVAQSRYAKMYLEYLRLFV